jgi:Asp-tRNA(Asn)/Glu-tRNA(Gln) amidotransferase A subunit family amidase
MPLTSYGALDALGLADLVRRREVTAAELLDEAIARAARINARLNAVVTPLHDEARRAIAAGLPDGPFAGVPFLLKDLDADCEGTFMSSGSRFLAGHRSTHDATLVANHGQLPRPRPSSSGPAGRS